MLFISPERSFRSFLSCLSSHVEKRLDQMINQANFKIYEIKIWETNKYNTHNNKNLRYQRQSGNKTWLVNIT